MPRRRDRNSSPQQRALIAGAAARLIAEDGIADYGTAKRKAARHLGIPESAGLPDDSEVELELRTRQRLFHDGEQQHRLTHLRRVALEVMSLVEPFTPYLSGSVADGSAGRHAEIDLQLFTDSAKDVEIFLLNRRLDFQHSVPRSERAEAVITLEHDGAIVNLVIYPKQEERYTAKGRDGRPRERIRLSALKNLLADVTTEDTQ
ncbi:hypothetical protein GH865_03570 [Rhodocyclus tenuis]|uniref:hypothetical protein n=1 Tax=Rhodocyclus gracilis TaxID=2929842 RepID=UPI001298DC0B|nr:hypothetical protein [Rhodocyclus gracilis]MRD72332.1 hypothetical protein [Rhodocyclus gracilis]